MKIQNRTEGLYSIKSTPKCQVAFKATPAQILDTLECSKLCPGKTRFLKNIAEFFDSLQSNLSEIADAPKNYVYKLGQENDLPKAIKDVEIGGVTLKSLDETLNTNPFKCSPTSTCGCGGGMNKGELAKKLFESLGIDEPDFIKISSKN